MEQLSPALSPWAGEGALEVGMAQEWAVVLQGLTEMFLSVFHEESPAGLPQRELGPSPIPNFGFDFAMSGWSSLGPLRSVCHTECAAAEELGSGGCLVPPA